MTILLMVALLQAAPGSDRAVAELLAADSAFAARSEARGLGAALEEYLAEDAIAPQAGGQFARGAAAVREAMLRPLFASAGVTWRPIRAGVSADGTHGFTFGYMTLERADSAPSHAKYMMYWERHDGMWKVRALKRAPAAAHVAAGATMLPPSLPLSPAPQGAASAADDRQSLAQAERAFSDEAQRIGLGAAFTQLGREDAVNMGPPDRPFVVGAAAIGEFVGAGGATDSSPVSWAADYEVVVAPSGDLGITFGVIRRNGADAAAPGFAFFTIWRRDGRSAPWRYIAE